MTRLHSHLVVSIAKMIGMFTGMNAEMRNRAGIKVCVAGWRAASMTCFAPHKSRSV
jgi:hypothetical protein